mgnify:CR=1 FL=1
MLNEKAVNGVFFPGQSLSGINIAIGDQVVSIGVDNIDNIYEKLKPYGAEITKSTGTKNLNLFDDDAIVLKEMPRKVTLESAKGSKKITVAFPDMDYLGFWHWPRVEVDYMCIEPWSSLPSRKDIVENLEKQENLLSLERGKEYLNRWSITISEKK